MTRPIFRCLNWDVASKCALAAVAALLLAVWLPAPAFGQAGAGLSISYDFFPFSRLSDPDTQPVGGQRNFEQDLEIRIKAVAVDLVVPFRYSEKTMLRNRLTYQRYSLGYEGWNPEQGGSPVEIMQAIELDLAVQRQLSFQWSGILSVTPGLYSDFENDISGDDFHIGVTTSLIRWHSKTLSYGFGFTYTFAFGQPLPLPLVTASWTNGRNLSLDAVLPMSVELWYAANPVMELGAAARVAGGRYHGSPDRYKLDNPQVEYSAGTVGPSFRFRLGSALRLQVDGGVTFLRRNEFTNADAGARSMGLSQSYFLKVTLTAGS